MDSLQLERAHFVHGNAHKGSSGILLSPFPPPKRRGFGGDPTGPLALTLAGPRQTDPPRRGAHPVRGPRGGPGRGRQRHGRLGSDLWRDLDHQGGHSGLQAARPGLR